MAVTIFANSADEQSMHPRLRSRAANSYTWSDKLREGSLGAAEVKQWLLDRCYFVEDVQDDPLWQRRDVDLLVDGISAEVKTDGYPANNMAIELTCDGKPGCLFKSRAESWLYYYRSERKLLWLSLPHLQWFVTGCLYKQQSYRHYQVYSRSRGRTWGAQGILIPISHLRTSGALWLEETI